MAKIYTRELAGNALSWAVGACELQRMQETGEPVKAWVLAAHAEGDLCGFNADDWLTVGPIMAREGICPRQLKTPPYTILERRHFNETLGDEVFYYESFKREMVRRKNRPSPLDGLWLAQYAMGTNQTVTWKGSDCRSPTAQTAIMRCYVAKVLGERVEIPDALCPAPGQRIA